MVYTHFVSGKRALRSKPRKTFPFKLPLMKEEEKRCQKHLHFCSSFFLCFDTWQLSAIEKDKLSLPNEINITSSIFFARKYKAPIYPYFLLKKRKSQ